VIPAELVQLLEAAEEATAAVADAFYERARADAEPSDWRAYTFLANARRTIGAAMIESGAVETAP
jgi:hypothetical protein